MARQANRLVVGRIRARVLVRVVAGDAGEAAGARAEAGASGQAQRLEPLRLRERERIQRIEFLLAPVAAAAQRVDALPVPAARVVDVRCGIAVLQRLNVTAARPVARLAADADEARLRRHLGGGHHRRMTGEAALRHRGVVHMSERIDRRSALARRHLPAVAEGEITHPELAERPALSAAYQGDAGLARAKRKLRGLRPRPIRGHDADEVSLWMALQRILETGRRVNEVVVVGKRRQEMTRKHGVKRDRVARVAVSPGDAGMAGRASLIPDELRSQSIGHRTGARERYGPIPWATLAAQQERHEPGETEK